MNTNGFSSSLGQKTQKKQKKTGILFSWLERNNGQQIVNALRRSYSLIKEQTNK